MANKQSSVNNKTSDATKKIRIDKWLWSARFFRTRSLAKKAIESGKIHMNGQRVKTSKEVNVGEELNVRQGSATSMSEKTIIVKSLSEQRGNATIAEQMYEETEESISRRESYGEQRKLANLARPDNKPNKKQRRELNKFKSDY